MDKFRQQFVDSFAVAIGGIILIIAVLSTIGTIFIKTYQGGEKDRIDRPELLIAIGILLGVIVLMTALSRMPENAGFLGKDVAIGSSGMWDAALPPVDPRAKYGELGSVADISEGYTLYAQSGALGTVSGMLPAGVDYGKRFSGMMYAHGVKSAAKEMWIPLEAVTAVYPGSRAAFLAIKGDETEALGWTAPPESMTRGTTRHMSAADKVK